MGYRDSTYCSAQGENVVGKLLAEEGHGETLAGPRRRRIVWCRVAHLDGPRDGVPLEPHWSPVSTIENTIVDE